MTILEDFNSYNNGDLNGQGTWSGSTNFDVAGGDPPAYEGAKGVLNATAAKTTIDGTVSGVEDVGGILSFYMQTSHATASRHETRLYEGANYVGMINMQGGDIFWSGDATEDIGDYVVDTWYHFELELDPPNNQFRVRVDGGSWQGAYPSSSDYTEIDTIQLRDFGSSADAVYWDYFTYEAPIVPSTSDFFLIL